MNDANTAKHLLEGKTCDNCQYFSQERKMNGKSYCFYDHKNMLRPDVNVCEHWKGNQMGD